MALRLASKRLLSPQIRQIASRALFSTAPAEDVAPTVFDKLISLTIVDPSGARRKIPGLVGECRERRKRRFSKVDLETHVIFLIFFIFQAPLFTTPARPTKSNLAP
jgi:hypothetical protein